MPLSNEMRGLAEGLLEATEQGRVNWIRFQQEFAVIFPRSSVRVWRWTAEEDGSEGVSFQLLNSEGVSVGIDTVDTDEPDFAIVGRLCELASRKVSKIDEALKDAMDSLKTDTNIGRAPPMTADDIPF